MSIVHLQVHAQLCIYMYKYMYSTCKIVTLSYCKISYDSSTPSSFCKTKLYTFSM